MWIILRLVVTIDTDIEAKDDTSSYMGMKNFLFLKRQSCFFALSSSFCFVIYDHKWSPSSRHGQVENSVFLSGHISTLFLVFLRWIIISGWTIRLTLTWNIHDGVQSRASSAGLRSNPDRKSSLFTDTGKVHFRLIFRGILKLWISWRKRKSGRQTNGAKNKS